MFDWFLPLFLFIIVAGFTPGPNNIIAMGIGFNWGFKKVLPHLAGVTVGFPIMLLLIGFILEPILEKFNSIFITLKFISAIYIIYLAYKIATAPVNLNEKKQKKPITFFESMAFQWINPKAWAGAMATVTLYLPKDKFTIALIVAAICSAITIIFAIALWGYIGKKIKHFFSNSKHIRLFNYTMATILCISVFMMILK